MSEGLVIDFEIDATGRGFHLRTTTKCGELVYMKIKCTPAAASEINALIVSKLAPIVAWRNGDLYQWAIKKIKGR